MNDFYVYLHRRQDTNEVFYVGKGVGNRLITKHNRSIKWNSIVSESGGYLIEKYVENVSEEEALSIERKLIDNPPVDWKLVNSKLSMETKVICPEEFSKYFYIDETSPSGLRWKVDIYSGTKNNVLSVRKDSVAGNKYFRTNGKPKCWRIVLKGRTYYCHRVIMAISNQDFNEKWIVNHIDTNPFNNSLSNLELSTPALNSRKTNKHINNDSIGVVKITVPNGSRTGTLDYYCATWYDLNRKQHTVRFSCKKLGESEALKLATERRNMEINKLNECNAGYPVKESTCR